MLQKGKINVKERYSDGEIDLSMSDLDEVPVKDIAAFKKTLSLDLSNNRLTYLPNNFIILTNLVKLDLSKNELVKLPEDFGSLSKLKYLDLYKNNLQHLPLSFGQLTSLKFLDLKDNPLVPAVSKIAGSCVDTKGCQQCARNIVCFYAKLQEEVNNEVEIRNKARQKQYEKNRQKKQEEKKKLKKDKLKEKKEIQVQGTKENAPILNNKDLLKSTKNLLKKSQKRSLYSPLFLYILILMFITFWILISFKHPFTKPLSKLIGTYFKLLLDKLPPSYQHYAEFCQHSVQVSQDYTKTVIQITLEVINRNEFIQDVLRKGNESYIKLSQIIMGTK